MSPLKRYPASQSRVSSSTMARSRRKPRTPSSKRKFSTASSTRPVPATTPYRRPFGNRRVKTSNTLRRSAVPARRAARSIVSSYWSVKSAVEGTSTGSPRSAVFMTKMLPHFASV